MLPSGQDMADGHRDSQPHDYQLTVRKLPAWRGAIEKDFMTKLGVKKKLGREEFESDRIQRHRGS